VVVEDRFINGLTYRKNMRFGQRSNKMDYGHSAMLLEIFYVHLLLRSSFVSHSVSLIFVSLILCPLFCVPPFWVPHPVSLILCPSFFVPHSVSLILCPSFRVPHSVSLILCPSFRVPHSVSLILCPSLCVPQIYCPLAFVQVPR
jgi:hypothetical protein